MAGCGARVKPKDSATLRRPEGKPQAGREKVQRTTKKRAGLQPHGTDDAEEPKRASLQHGEHSTSSATGAHCKERRQNEVLVAARSSRRERGDAEAPDKASHRCRLAVLQARSRSIKEQGTRKTNTRAQRSQDHDGRSQERRPRRHQPSTVQVAFNRKSRRRRDVLHTATVKKKAIWEAKDRVYTARAQHSTSKQSGKREPRRPVTRQHLPMAPEQQSMGPDCTAAKWRTRNNGKKTESIAHAALGARVSTWRTLRHTILGLIGIPKGKTTEPLRQSASQGSRGDHRARHHFTSRV